MMAVMQRVKQKKKKKQAKKAGNTTGTSNLVVMDSDTKPNPDPDADPNADPEPPSQSLFRAGGPVDLCFYLFFVGVFIAMAVAGRSRGDLNYSQTESLRNKLIEQDTFGCYNCEEPTNFAGIRTAADVYYYIEDVLLFALFSDERINGSKITDPKKQAYVSSQSRLLAGFRLKQVRMAEAECVGDDNNTFAPCWSTDDFSTEDFIGNGMWADNPYEYVDSSFLEDQRWSGKYGAYPGGGYIEDFLIVNSSANRSNVIKNLINGDWIDGGTRAVMVDFTTFNPSSLIHSVVRIAVEMPGGGIFPYHEFKSWVFMRYVGSDGTTLYLLNAIFGAVVFIRTISLLVDMFGCRVRPCRVDGCKNRCSGVRKWIGQGWNKMECLNLLCFDVMILLFIANISYTNTISMTDINDYQSFRRLQYIFKSEANLQAIGGILLLLKMFKFLGVNKKFAFLFTMFAESSQGLFVFFVILCVFFTSFGMAGFLLFCSDVRDFRSFSYAMANMVRYTVAELDYSELSSSSSTVGSAYYFAWSILMLLVLANVFVAILSEAYVRVASRFEDDEDIDIGGGLKNMVTKFSARAKSVFFKEQNHEAVDLDGDGLVSVDELVEMYGIAKEEAQRYIDKYDTDGDGQLSKAEFDKWMAIERESTDNNDGQDAGGGAGVGAGVEIVRLRSASNSAADTLETENKGDDDNEDDDEDDDEDADEDSGSGSHLKIDATHHQKTTDYENLDTLVSEFASGRATGSSRV